MPSETTTVEKTWRHWSGTPSDIVRLARRSEELLAAANVENPVAKVSVRHRRGESTYASAEEASQHVGELDVDAVKSVHIIAGDVFRGVYIAINFHRSGPYLKVEGTGDHHLSVTGIADELTAALDRGDRPPHERVIGWTLLGVGETLTAGALIVAIADESSTLSLALAFGGLVLVLPAMWILWIRILAFSGFDLHGDGDLSRADLWGGRIRRFGAWAVSLVLAAVLGALIQHWLG
jgi:hypothetical protein